MSKEEFITCVFITYCFLTFGSSEMHDHDLNLLIKLLFMHNVLCTFVHFQIRPSHPIPASFPQLQFKDDRFGVKKTKLGHESKSITFLCPLITCSSPYTIIRIGPKPTNWLILFFSCCSSPLTLFYRLCSLVLPCLLILMDSSVLHHCVLL